MSKDLEAPSTVAGSREGHDHDSRKMVERAIAGCGAAVSTWPPHGNIILSQHAGSCIGKLLMEVGGTSGYKFIVPSGRDIWIQ